MKNWKIWIPLIVMITLSVIGWIFFDKSTNEQKLKNAQGNNSSLVQYVQNVQDSPESSNTQIINPKPTYVVDQNMKEKLTSDILKFGTKDTAIRLWYKQDSLEAKKLASEFFDFLKSEGYDIDSYLVPYLGYNAFDIEVTPNYTSDPRNGGQQDGINIRIGEPK